MTYLSYVLGPIMVPGVDFIWLNKQDFNTTRKWLITPVTFEPLLHQWEVIAFYSGNVLLVEPH